MIDLNFIHLSPFYELAALLFLATVFGLIGSVLRQPMIVSFIAVGILSGPSALGIIQSNDNIQLLSELGVCVLLFLVGLKLDVKLIRTLGPVSLATGLGQVLFTSLIGFFIAMYLGMNVVTSLYVAVALTFSSTIIIVKLLSDKREVDSLYGRIAIGFLIVQDLVVVVVMMVLSTLSVGSQDARMGGVSIQLMMMFVQVFFLLVVVGFFVRYIATPLMNRIARTPELLIISAIGWAALLAAIGNYLGFSKELGGLLAGVSLASTPFREAIVSRLSSLRDFLLLFFFINLGVQLDLSSIGNQIFSAILLSFFVLIGNPIIVMVIMGYMGYRKRTGFLAGLTVAQISEFSLILMAMGLTLGHVTNESLGLVTLIGFITIALSVYMITYSHSLYHALEPVLGVFERKIPEREEKLEGFDSTRKRFDVILFGLGRYGSAIAESLLKENIPFLGIDFNPIEVKYWCNRGYDAIYGDACDQAFISSLPLHEAKWVISAIPQYEIGLTHEDPRMVLLDALKQHHYEGKVAVSTQNTSEQDALLQKGADLILLPFSDAAKRVVERIKEQGI